MVKEKRWGPVEYCLVLLAPTVALRKHIQTISGY